jgi:hypothetical protein
MLVLINYFVDLYFFLFNCVLKPRNLSRFLSGGVWGHVSIQESKQPQRYYIFIPNFNFINSI